jgi:hypothetical protein
MNGQLGLLLAFFATLSIYIIYKKFVILNYKQNLLLIDMKISTKYTEMNKSERFKNKTAYENLELILERINNNIGSVTLFSIILFQYSTKTKENHLIDEVLTKIRNSDFAPEFKELDNYSISFIKYQSPILFSVLIIASQLRQVFKLRFVFSDLFKDIIKYEYEVAVI